MIPVSGLDAQLTALASWKDFSDIFIRHVFTYLLAMIFLNKNLLSVVEGRAEINLITEPRST